MRRMRSSAGTTADARMQPREVALDSAVGVRVKRSSQWRGRFGPRGRAWASPRLWLLLTRQGRLRRSLWRRLRRGPPLAGDQQRGGRVDERGLELFLSGQAGTGCPRVSPPPPRRTYLHAGSEITAGDPDDDKRCPHSGGSNATVTSGSPERRGRGDRVHKNLAHRPDERFDHCRRSNCDLRQLGAEGGSRLRGSD